MRPALCGTNRLSVWVLDTYRLPKADPPLADKSYVSFVYPAFGGTHDDFLDDA
jgi:hypothetical protein